MKKKILFSLIIFVLVFAVGAAVKTRAGTGESGRGWLWGGGAESDGVSPWDGINTNVRWISMNCTDREAATGKVCLDGNNPLFNPAVNIVDYGVNIPLSGPVTGYAWSGGDDGGPGLGYVNFSPSPPFPASPSTGVVRTGNNLEGWARFEEIRIAGANAGGWEGWIKMSGIADDLSPYGVTIDPSTGDLSGCIPSSGDNGCAWSDELGWIDFSNADIVLVDILKICADDCDNGGETPLTETVDLTEGERRNLKACYNTSTVCDDATGDVTFDGTTTWDANDSPNNAVTLTDDIPNNWKILIADTAGDEDVSVTYGSGSASFTANVTGVCSYNICDEGSGAVPYECETISGAEPCPQGDGCSVGTTCYPPDYNWREVAP